MVIIEDIFLENLQLFFCDQRRKYLSLFILTQNQSEIQVYSLKRDKYMVFQN